MSGHTRAGDNHVYTRDELLDSMRDFIIEEGRLPTSRDADKGTHGLPTVKAYAREFGSWREGLSALGMQPDPRGGHNKGQSKHAPKAKKTKKGRSGIAPTKG